MDRVTLRKKTLVLRRKEYKILSTKLSEVLQ